MSNDNSNKKQPTVLQGANPQLLLQLVPPGGMRMPFGKYKDQFLCNLPVYYLEWFQKKGFPKGRLGILLEMLYEIKINGLEHLLEPLKGKAG